MPTDPQKDASPDSTKLKLFLIIALAALTRFLFLTRKSFWLDEGASVALARLPWPAFIDRLSTHEANMAVYYFLLRPWLYFGNSEFWIRTLSVLPGIATIPVVYAIGKKLFDRRIGLAASLLLSVHVGHVAYSQEARGYSLAVFFASISCLYFLRIMDDGHAADLALYVLFTALAVYTHFFAGLIVAAQFLSLAALDPQLIPRRRLLVSFVCIVILCVPAAAFALSKDVGQLAWVPKTSLKELHHTATLLTGNGPVLILYLLLWLAAMNAALATWRKRSINSWRYAFVLSWLFTPLILILLISPRKPILAPRFLLASVPAAVLLCALGVFRLHRFTLRTASLTLVVLVSVAALAGYYRKPKEDWRGVTQYVLSHAQPTDLVLTYPRWDAVAVDYYRSRFANSTAPTFEELPFNDTTAVTRLAPQPRVWLIIYDWRLHQDPSAQRVRQLLDQSYKESAEQHFGDIDVLRFDAGSR
jgi:mannosyltransferase